MDLSAGFARISKLTSEKRDRYIVEERYFRYRRTDHISKNYRDSPTSLFRASTTVVRIFTSAALSNYVWCANQRKRINTPVIISASIHTKSMLNHARRNIVTPSFS